MVIAERIERSAGSKAAIKRMTSVDRVRPPLADTGARLIEYRCKGAERGRQQGLETLAQRLGKSGRRSTRADGDDHR